ncbi:MAG: hypothetical protein ACLQDY_30075 [Streptosporangiaceae bacterium]
MPGTRSSRLPAGDRGREQAASGRPTGVAIAGRTGSAVRRPPAIDPLVGSFLAAEDLTGRLLDRRGSPLNVVFPRIFAANVAELRRVLDGSGLGYWMFGTRSAPATRR